MAKKDIQEYFVELKNGIDKLSIDKLEEIIKLILRTYKTGRQIFIFGNGGSSATASHFACDMNKGVSYSLKKRLKVICLNDNVPALLAYGNDISYCDIFIEQLKNFLNPGDLVIGISASGNSENVLKAIRYANRSKAHTIGLSGFNGGKLAKIAQLSFVVSINDMQKVEDVHLIVCHILMQGIGKIIKR